MNFKRTAPLLLTAAAMALAAGCGGEDERFEGEVANTRAQAIVGAGEIQRQPRRSPGRAVLETWRLMQFRDQGDMIERFTAAARAPLTGPRFARLLHQDLGPWALRAHPRVERVDEVGGTATVYTRVTVRAPVGSNLVRRSQELAAFPLERRGGRWLISSSAFFLAQAETLAEQRVREEKRAARSAP